MKPHYILLAAVAATSLYAIAAPDTSLPDPWILSGKSPQLFDAGIDQSATGGTKGAKFIRRAKDGDKGDDKDWATIMQQIAADDYRGKRVRFQARVKTQNVSDWAGLWMRVDTPAKQNAVFYNSSDKPIKGSTDWQIRDVVLDVPGDASVISFGVIDSGKGEVWIDGLKLDVVDASVATSVQAAQRGLPRKPSL